LREAIPMAFSPWEGNQRIFKGEAGNGNPFLHG
jgi:hypothetical protein